MLTEMQSYSIFNIVIKVSFNLSFISTLMCIMPFIICTDKSAIEYLKEILYLHTKTHIFGWLYMVEREK